MLQILILVLIFDNFTNGIPTPDRTQTRVCSENRCCTTEPSSTIIESSATEQEQKIIPGRCALPNSVDTKVFYFPVTSGMSECLKIGGGE